MGRYSNILTKYSVTGKKYNETVKYPNIPLSFGDRFDILALAYYNDPTLWWVISIANPQFNQGSMFPPLGVQIRIPGNIGAIINEYQQLNVT